MRDWVDLYPNRTFQTCCGGGGGTLVTGYNEERLHYGRRKMEQIRATGAETIVVPCHSCHAQLEALRDAYGMPELEVKYLWELVAELLVLD